MPVIPALSRSQVDPATGAKLDAVKAKLGTIPNMFLTFAHSPVALNAYLQLAEVTARGKLNARQREQVALAVAEANDCGYCLAAHAAIGKLVGLGENQIGQARLARGDNPRDSAILGLARAIVEQRGHVAAEAIRDFKAQGFGDADVLEVLVNVVHNIYTNYTNHLAGTEIDFPQLARTKAA